MKILGISAFYHDSAAALVVDGVIVAAAQEERFTRKKHDAAFPAQAVEYCLREAELQLEDIDHCVFYEKPFPKFERLLDTYLSFAPRGFESFRMAIPIWLKEKLFQKTLLGKELGLHMPEGEAFNGSILFSEHHLSHAASAFYPSPFDEAAILTLDGVGEWATTSLALGKGNGITLEKEIHFPHSLGLLYSAFTYYLGFKVNSGEYKVMGLAPYGEPKYTQLIMENILDLKEDGTFRLNLDYFDYCTGLTMTNHRFEKLMGQPVRGKETLLTQWHMDVAASLQKVTEEVLLRLTRSVQRETGAENLCLAGGVALNCVANGKILRDGKFKKIWIQPASGDAGGALGAALAAYYLVARASLPRNTHGNDAMRGSYLGPEFTQVDISKRLAAAGAVVEELDDDGVIEKTAKALADGLAIGWFQGRMEFGPRSLGNRSIIADASSPKMQSELNLKVKFRESFRPFAPSVLREDVAEWFELDSDSPYMLLVADVVEGRRKKMTDDEQKLFGIEKLNVPRSEIPSVTHVDYSARVQTVHRNTNPRFHDLIVRFKGITGRPVIVNTSFNVRGEPIVCTPEDAFRCFMGTGLDVLVVGNCFMQKNRQDTALVKDYKDKFELD